jgi:hypothetical protein
VPVDIEIQISDEVGADGRRELDDLVDSSHTATAGYDRAEQSFEKLLVPG